jgi:hypothetical protein
MGLPVIVIGRNRYRSDIGAQCVAARELRTKAVAFPKGHVFKQKR